MIYHNISQYIQLYATDRFWNCYSCNNSKNRLNCSIMCSQFDQPSITPLSVAGCGRLQLWATHLTHLTAAAGYQSWSHLYFRTQSQRFAYAFTQGIINKLSCHPCIYVKNRMQQTKFSNKSWCKHIRCFGVTCYIFFVLCIQWNRMTKISTTRCVIINNRARNALKNIYY